MKRLLFSSWLFHSFPPVEGAGFRWCRSSLSDCKQARPAGGASNKNWSYSVPLPHPPASHLPARTAEIRLKSTLQGPKGTGVLKQGGQPTDCEREGLQEFWAVGPTWWRALEHGISLSIQKETQKNL